MNEEIMNNTNEEIMENNEVTELTEVYAEPADVEGSGSTVVKIVLVGLGAAAVAVGVKNRNKIKELMNQRRIKKLEKQGFKVEFPDIVEEEDFEVDCDDDGTGNIIEINEEE